MFKPFPRLMTVFALVFQTSVVCASAFYDFDGDFHDSFGTSADVVAHGGSLIGGAYVFGPNQGLTLEWSNFDGSDYDVSLAFSFSNIGTNFAWRKVVDFTQRGSDGGLYVFNNRLQFVVSPGPFGSDVFVDGPTGSFAADRLVNLRFTRDDSTRQFSAYIDGELQFSFEDVLGRAIFPSTGVATFLMDDFLSGQSEASGGRIEFLTVTTIPLPPAVLLFGSALGGLGWLRRRTG